MTRIITTLIVAHDEELVKELKGTSMNKECVRALNCHGGKDIKSIPT